MENSDNLKEIWNKIVQELELEIGKDSIDLWIKPLKPIVIEGNILKIEVPNSIFYKTISEKYEKNIAAIIKKITGKDFTMDYSISLSSAEEKKENNQTIQYIKSEEKSKQEKLPPFINPYYTFDSIVVGDFNRFAYNVAKNISQYPGTNQNPFFIYSPPGMGKTHLLHAIANEIFRTKPHLKILYISTESFVNEFISALQEKNPDAFRNKYRKLDCFLLDDVQFFTMGEKKIKSEEEFFYTFNTLFELKKQIVITSDRNPSGLNLDERLTSRFKSGTIADIARPEYEARVAILNEENEKNKFNIPQDVINFIAEKIADNIRSLKGCISTVGHYSVQNNIYPSIDLAQNLIKDYINPHEESTRDKLNIKDIEEIVAENYGVSISELKSKNKTDRIAFARQVAMYLMCTLTDKSLPEIGELFKKDHSTVIYARNKITQMMNSDPFLSEQINSIVNKIKSKKI